MSEKKYANDAYIWQFLKGKGLNDFAVAGIMANLYAESAFIPTNLQNSYEKKFGLNDAQYTAAVDNGTYTNFDVDRGGYGLAQWTNAARKRNLLAFAKSQGKSIGDLQMQLDFLWKEMQEYTTMMPVLWNAKSILEAAAIFMLKFERPANQTKENQERRGRLGQPFYDKFAGKVVDPGTIPESPQVNPGATQVSSYRYNKAMNYNDFVVALNANQLNIRSGPSKSCSRNGELKGKGTTVKIATSVEEIETGTNWGLIAEGEKAGNWIDLSFTQAG